jgi:hypothetical protein
VLQLAAIQNHLFWVGLSLTRSSVHDPDVRDLLEFNKKRHGVSFYEMEQAMLDKVSIAFILLFL